MFAMMIDEAREKLDIRPFPQAQDVRPLSLVHMLMS